MFCLLSLNEMAKRHYEKVDEILETGESDGYGVDDEGTNMEEYNCGGFALGNKEWYLPYDYESWDDYIDSDSMMHELSKEDLLEVYVNHMLVEMPNLRIIGSEHELVDGEVLVLFRIGDDDFHFVRKNPQDGKYYHKMGWLPEIYEMSKEEVYSDDWLCRYDSRIVMFALLENYENAEEAV